MNVSQPDLDVLALPLEGQQLIEASAGTGKTYTIAGLYTRLIIEARWNVRQILVLTYTRAATEELKQRLRARLTLCAQLAADPQAPVVGAEADLCRALLARAQRDSGALPESLDALARRLKLAALGMDEAAISTIHGFCQRALREHAFASGSQLPAGDIVPSDRDLLEECARDMWRELSARPDPADLEAFRQLLPTHEELARLLAELLDERIQLAPAAPAQLPDVLALATRAEAAFEVLQQCWQEFGEATFSELLAQVKNKWLDGRKYSSKRFATWLAALRAELPEGGLADPQSFALLAPSELRAHQKPEAPELSELRFLSALELWRERQKECADAQQQRARFLLAQAVRNARVRLRTRKLELGRASFDDLVQGLHHALFSAPTSDSGAALADALFAQYPSALIDEFQDTDERQFEIFSRIYQARGALYLVGDPKQAIYRFRGGDVHAYLRAARGAHARGSLTRNFRSSPSLLRALDIVFGRPGPAPFVDEQIRFEGTHAGGTCLDDDFQIDGVAVPALNLWHVAQNSSKERARAALARGCASQIAKLLAHARAQPPTATLRTPNGRRALAPSDLAVLVNSHWEAAAMQTELVKLGVSSVCVHRRSVFASSEAAELTQLMQALLTPQDPGAVRAALATELLGYGLLAITALQQNPQAWRQLMQQLWRWRQRWFEFSILALLEQVYALRAPVLLGLSEGERRMTNHLHLAELLQQASPQLFDAQGMLDWLRARIRRADNDNEAEQLRLESDTLAVQIVTLHKAKGLEYGVVFLPFAALPAGVSQQQPQRYREQLASGGYRLWVVNAQTPPSAELAQAKLADAREQLAERVRVFYVGMTRARHACYLAWGALGSKGAPTALHHLLHPGEDALSSVQTQRRLDQLAELSPEAIQVAQLPAPSGMRLPDELEAELPQARSATRLLDHAWWVLSFSQLQDGLHVELPRQAGADDEPVSAPVELPELHAASELPDGPRGTRFGSALHEILEHTDFAAWRTAAPLAQSEVALIDAKLRKHALLSAENIATLPSYVGNLLSATLRTRLPCGISLAELAPSARRAELEFYFGFASVHPRALLSLLQQYGYQTSRLDFARMRGQLSGLMNGTIDLVFEHQGRFYLVDYKTNMLGLNYADYAPQALHLAIRASDYDLQYLIYTLALHRWLKQVFGSAYHYEQQFGEAYYLFARGMRGDGSTGIYRDRPPLALILALDALFAQ